MRYSVVFMNITEILIATGSTATAPQPINQVIKPIKFPAQPQEWKIVSLRECPTPDTMQHCETPDQAAAYWKSHIATHPYFNSECECLVVFILNTLPETQRETRSRGSEEVLHERGFF